MIHPRWWIKGPIIRFSGWVPTNQEASNTGIRETNYLSPRRRQHTSAGQHLLVVRDALSSTDQAYIDDEIAQNDRRILGLAQAAYEGRGVPVAQPLPIPKQKWVPKNAHGKANARGLTGAEIAARELNAREREQRLQERDQLALNMTLGASTAAEIPQFGPRDVSVVTGQQNEILIVRATPPPPPEESVARATPLPFKDSLPAPQEEEKEENPFILPASTAPALLQTNARPKRARGPTLDYKAMHEGKQNQPKRGK